MTVKNWWLGAVLLTFCTSGCARNDVPAAPSPVAVSSPQAAPAAASPSAQPAATASPSPNWRSLSDQGIDLALHNQFKAAKTPLESAHKLNPSDVNTCFWLFESNANTESKSSKNSPAYRTAQEVVRLAPGTSQADKATQWMRGVDTTPVAAAPAAKKGNGHLPAEMKGQWRVTGLEYQGCECTMWFEPHNEHPVADERLWGTIDFTRFQRVGFEGGTAHVQTWAGNGNVLVTAMTIVGAFGNHEYKFKTYSEQASGDVVAEGIFHFYGKEFRGVYRDLKANHDFQLLGKLLDSPFRPVTITWKGNTATVHGDLDRSSATYP